MLNLKKVAITGGLSSGKSTVCKIFRNLGAYTVSSDEIVHNLLENNRTLQRQIVNLLGSDILTNNLPDREKIAKQVFSNPEKLQALEGLIHPAVFHEIQSQYDKVKNSGKYILFVAEVPLLYESKGEGNFDAVITVVSEEKKCKDRFKILTNKSESQFDDRMMRQMSPKTKAAKANYLIMNNDSLEKLEAQVAQLSSKLRSI